MYSMVAKSRVHVVTWHFTNSMLEYPAQLAQTLPQLRTQTVHYTLFTRQLKPLYIPHMLFR
jgi:hypothetical protein